MVVSLWALIMIRTNDMDFLKTSSLVRSLCESGLPINCIATGASEASRMIDPI